MTCLSDSACDEIRDTLTGIGRAWWEQNRGTVQQLATEEAYAVAVAMTQSPTHALRATMATMEPAELLAAARSVTKSMREINERVADRVDLAMSLLDLAPDVLAGIGRVLWSRLP